MTLRHRVLSAAALVAFFGVIGTSQPSMAVTITFGVSPAPNPYVESGFQVDPLSIVSGNCDGVSGKPCLALNTNATSTLTQVGGGAFTLNSFGFEFEGQPSVLTVTAFTDSGATLVDTIVYGGPSDPAHPDKNVWYVVSPAIANITSIVFDDTGTGNVRIDDIDVTAATTRGGNDSSTPLPAALPLFGTGLGALGLLGWRRKRKQAA